MKRKIIFISMLAALAVLVVVQGCKKEQGPGFTTHDSFTTPTLVGPANESTIHLGVGVTTVTLEWASTNASGDPIKADVYFGTTDVGTPLYAAGQTALSLNVPVEIGATYYWYVVMTDKNNVTTTGPTWTFTIFDPIAIFTGSFKADEPAESYFYTVHFAKTNDSTTTTDNYWNSGWEGPFIINFAHNTYHMDLQNWGGGWTGEEAGTVDPETGTMIGDYTIWNNGTVIETGTHTYTHN